MLIMFDKKKLWQAIISRNAFGDTNCINNNIVVASKILDFNSIQDIGKPNYGKQLYRIAQ